MYMGVKSYHDLPAVHCYADAERAMATFNNRKSRAKTVNSVNFDADTGAIAFKLYETEVVTWYPGDAIDIDNYGSMTTSAFARHFLPSPIRLNYPTQRRGECGGNKLINFLGRDEAGERVYAVCQGELVRFNPTPDGRWAPDEDSCDGITLPVGVDARTARKAMAQFHLRDFELWLAMAPMHLDRAGDRIEHTKWDLDECMHALRRRDFRQAAMHMPTMKDTGAYGHKPRPLPITTPYQEYISPGCVTKLKLAIWDDEDLLLTQTRRTWARKEFDRCMRRVREMNLMNLASHGFGPSNI